MKKLWIGMGIVIIGALAIVLIVTQTKKEPEAMKIGAILPLTGDTAIYGQEIKNGIELGVERINQKGGINRKKIKIIYEDDQGQAKIGVSAIEKLIKIDKVPAIIGGAMSSVAIPIAPIANKNKVVLLSPTATAPILSGISKYFFRIWPSDNYGGAVMAKFALDTLKLRRVSILFLNTDYGKGIAEVFIKEFKKLGGQVLTVESYELGVTDVKTQLSKIWAQKPEAIYMPGYYKEFAIILKQAQEMGLKAQFLSNDAFYNPDLLKIAGEAAEGAIFTYPPFDPESDEPIIKDFVESFNSKYGKKPDAFAVQGYDAMNILAFAIEKGGYSAEGIRNALSDIKDFPCVGGKTTFDELGDVVRPLRFITVKNGEFIPFVTR